MTTATVRAQRRVSDRMRRRRLHGINARVYLPVLRRRQSGVCPLCGEALPKAHRDVHVDHILPVNQGGKSRPYNLQAVHSSCNLRKPRGSSADLAGSIKAGPTGTENSGLADPDDSTTVNKIMNRMFKRGQQLGPDDAKLLEHFEGHTHRVMEATAGKIRTVTGLSVNIPDHVARKIVAGGGTHLLSMDIQGQTRKALFSALAESRAAGHHPSSAATRKLIQKHVTAGRFVNAGPKYRAKLIARTETMYAQNESALATYESSDAIQQVEVADDMMGHGDADCSARAGTIMTISNARNVQDHPNGTLRFLPVLKDDVIEKPTTVEEAMGQDIVREAEGDRNDEDRKFTLLHRADPDRIPDPLESGDYWGGGYRNFNKNLRDGQPIFGADAKIASDLRGLMKPSSSPKITYRGVRKFDGDLTPGNVLSFREPLSTSYNPNVARTFRGRQAVVENDPDAVLFMVRSPKGTRSIVTNTPEQEVTLDFGTRWRVIKEHRKPVKEYGRVGGNLETIGHERIIEVEVMP